MNSLLLTKNFEEVYRRAGKGVARKLWQRTYAKTPIIYKHKQVREEIRQILREVTQGVPSRITCWKLNISRATYFRRLQQLRRASMEVMESQKTLSDAYYEAEADKLIASLKN